MSLKNILLLNLLVFSQAFSQPHEYKLITSIPLKGKYITSDKLRNVFVINDQQELLKFSPDGIFQYRHNITSLGKISQVDVQNPLKVLVLYSDFSTIVILDNTLSQISRINIFETGATQVTAACVAADNNIWIYDEISNKLRKFNDQLNEISESEDMYALLGKTVRATFMQEKDKFVYLNDPENGILVFDVFGTYIKTIPLKGLKNFQKVQDQLVYFIDGKLRTYHLLTFDERELSLPGENAIDARMEIDRLFVLRADRLDVYSY